MLKYLGGLLGKKRANRFTNKKRVAPFRRYKNMPFDYNKVRVEAYDTLAVSQTSDAFFFQNSGYQYITLTSILANSSSFMQYQPEYVRYKITGFKVDISNVSSPEHLRTTFANGAPGCAIAFYPQNTTQGMGISPRNKDNNLVVFPNVTEIQSKYWSVPDSLMDTGSGGLGTWNSCNNYGSQTGQLHTAPLESGNNASANVNVFFIRIAVYCVFSGKID